jgi:hypothetical protein
MTFQILAVLTILEALVITLEQLEIGVVLGRYA